ncbi:hypothetical protein C5O78_02115 [Treponema phagedenis]|nr:hypothetical protein C5O78_02115 [Treponema phagedenis]
MSDSERAWTPVVPNRIEFENYRICIIGVFKLIGIILPRTSKLRTGTDGGGSKQKRCFKAG